MSKQGYVVLYENFDDHIYVINDYGRIDITNLLDIKTIKKDIKAGIVTIQASIKATLIDEDI